MTEEQRDNICTNIIRNMCRGMDFGAGQDKMKVLAVNGNYTKALVKVPGHTGWASVGQREYYSPCVYLWDTSLNPTHSLNHREVMEITRSNRLTEAKLIELMAEHLKPIGWTYEGMTELDAY